MNHEHLHQQHARIIEAALRLNDAAEALARDTYQAATIPAPTLYDVLGNLKVALWALTETAASLSEGIGNSHNDPDIHITDHDPNTSEPRDPAESLRLADAALHQLAATLTQAANAAEHAQAEINGQGYSLTSGHDAIPSAQRSA